MLRSDSKGLRLEGPAGSLPVRPDDEIVRKLAMLFEGECEGLGPTAAARKHGFSKQRYFQLRHAFESRGAIALQSARRGPKTRYRRTAEVVRQVIRHRFLDPDASADVIAQKLRQCGWTISVRSVQAAIHQLRQRLPPPCNTWDARHLARNLLAGLDGDLRVHDDTIIVTYYNAPRTETLKPLYEGLPRTLEREGIDPHVPWLWNFKLDFRFR